MEEYTGFREPYTPLQKAAKEADKFFGGKINGSGGGGCMFAYAPNNPKTVANAIENAGGKAYIVQSDIGTRIEG